MATSQNYVRPALQEIDGLWLPKYGFSSQQFRSSFVFSPRPEDVFVASYPTCGTAWTQYIVWEILSDCAPIPDTAQELNRLYFPLLEMIEPEEELPSQSPSHRRRMLKIYTPATHAPYRQHSARYIYVARNPKSCLVSYYYLHLAMPEIFSFRGTFDDFFRSFMDGRVAWGDYWDHVMSWFRLQQRSDNVLFLTHEKMKIDKTGTVLHIGRFLGDEDLVRRSGGTRLEKIVGLVGRPDANIAHKRGGRTKEALASLDAVRYDDRVDFARFSAADALGRMAHGLDSDWRNHLSEEQNRAMDEKIREKFGGTYLCDLWQSRK